MSSTQEPNWNRLPGASPSSESTALALPSRTFAQAPPPAKGMNFGKLAWDHKFVILAFVVMGTLGGTIGVVMKKPMYQATTSVEMVGFNQGFMGMASVDPQAGTDAVRESNSNTQTQIKILTSRTLLRKVIDRMNLELTPITNAPATFFTRVRKRIPFGQKDPFEQSREALQLAAATVSVRAVQPTRLIEITCQSTSPDMAANFVNTVASEHIAQAIAARANVTQKTSQWMESQLEEARARLQQAGEKLRDFVQKSGTRFLSRTGHTCRFQNERIAVGSFRDTG